MIVYWKFFKNVFKKVVSDHFLIINLISKMECLIVGGLFYTQ